MKIKELPATTTDKWEGKKMWTAGSFRKKHNKKLSEGQADQASHVANAILKETGDEGKAVRIANWQAKKGLRRHGHKKTHRPESPMRRGEMR